MTDRRFPAAAAATLLLTLLTAASASAQTVPAQRREHGNLVFDGVPQPNAALAALLERYQQSRSATFLDWAADGSMLVATRFGDSEQVHRVAAPLAMREQLTFDSDPIEWARAARSGSGFVFLKDHAGDENAQVYYQGANGVKAASVFGGIARRDDADAPLGLHQDHRNDGQH